jgi:hypothetical protein
LKTERIFTRMSEHSHEMLVNMALAYKLAPTLILRVIIESVLDAASEDGNLQAEIAAGARRCRQTGQVPDCWLELEGDFIEGDFTEGDFDEHFEGSEHEEGPDDSGSGNYFGNEKAMDREMRQSWAEYGDHAAQWGERDDNQEYCRMAREAAQKRQEAA